MRYSGVPKAAAIPGTRPGKVRPFMSGRGEIVNGRLTSRMFGSMLTGYFSGCEDRVDTVLRRAHEISVQKKAERINGVECPVITAETDSGNYKIWIDPDYGHNISKAQVSLAEGRSHYFYGKPFETAGRALSVSLQNVRFRRIQGIWLPVEADISYRRVFDGILDANRSETHVKITDVLLDPDHDAMRSFGADDIPDGAVVTAFVNLNKGFITAWDPEYRWLRDAEFVVDRKGRRLRYDPNSGMLPVVMALPELRELELKIEPSQTRNKKILLCFCDMTQPASRQCVLDLRDQAESLEKNNVLIALLHCLSERSRASPALDEGQRSQLPRSGASGEGTQQILRAWRAHKLPWLVLADSDHLVVAEGFEPADLGEKIEAADQTTR